MTPRKGSVIFVLIAGAIGVLMMHQPSPTVPASVLEDTWWGPNNRKADQSIKPFRITFSEDVSTCNIVSNLKVHVDRDFSRDVYLIVHKRQEKAR